MIFSQSIINVGLFQPIEFEPTDVALYFYPSQVFEGGVPNVGGRGEKLEASWSYGCQGTM
jgi:hypothetical protein